MIFRAGDKVRILESAVNDGVLPYGRNETGTVILIVSATCIDVKMDHEKASHKGLIWSVSPENLEYALDGLDRILEKL